MSGLHKDVGHVQIGALKDLKKELGLRRNSLVKAMIAEVERALYEDLHARPHTEIAVAASHHLHRQSSERSNTVRHQACHQSYAVLIMSHPMTLNDYLRGGRDHV